MKHKKPLDYAVKKSISMSARLLNFAESQALSAGFTTLSHYIQSLILRERNAQPSEPLAS